MPRCEDSNGVAAVSPEMGRYNVKLRVIIADDHPGMLEWLVAAVRKECEVVAAVQDGAAALEAAARLDPDIIVLDCAMSPMNGFEVMRALQETGARTAVVFVTGHSDPELAKAALAEGALGFLVKFRLAQDLLPAIRFAGQKVTSRNPSQAQTARNLTGQ